jgi:hypothetical protein
MPTGWLTQARWSGLGPQPTGNVGQQLAGAVTERCIGAADGSPYRLLASDAGSRRRFYEAVVSGALTHGGDSRLARHVGNPALREDACGARLAKERRDSPRRIEATVAAVMAHDRAAALAGVNRDSIYL